MLDEPTIGLHPRDTARLIGLLRDLRDAGNTVVVVEHDLDVIAAADHLIEIGPGAGTGGGRLVAQGTPAEVRRVRSSRTARLLGRRPAPGDACERRPLVPGITIRGAAVHNLNDLDVDVPAGGLVCVTGVSGSGKSSLVFDVLAASTAGAPGVTRPTATRAVNCRACTLHVPFASVIVVDHASAGASPWSNPATHTGLFDDIRDLFARSDTAVARGIGRKHFSTQVCGGRCETCEGRGQMRVAMDFLPDIWMTCDDCGGKRYGSEVLACTMDGRSIADVLDMTVDEALDFFAARPLPVPDGQPAGAIGRIVHGLDVLRDVGLGYVRAGQPTRTLSGGERQRLLLATGLLLPGHGPTFYLFDEPTTGLHADDVVQMLRVFDRLIAAGHTLVVVEHNLDVIARADWVIDLGPDGGPGGGRLVASGPPAAIAACPGSYTGRALLDLGRPA